MHHALVIPLKLTPTESEYFPDVILALDSEIAKKMNDLILTLNKGTEISFNATIVSLGHDRKTRHFHVVDIKKESGFMEVSELVHSQGRYADKPNTFLRNALGTNNPPPTNILPVMTPEPTKKEEEPVKKEEEVKKGEEVKKEEVKTEEPKKEEIKSTSDDEKKE